MCAEKSRADIVEDVRAQIVDYVRFRERRGDPITYQAALLGHRQVVVDAMRDDHDQLWSDRLSWLDSLCAEEGL